MVQMAKQLTLLVAVSGMMLCANGEGPVATQADDAVKVVADTLQKIGDDSNQLFLNRDYQWCIACFFTLFGMVALVDGRNSLKILVAVAVGFATFGFQLHQLHPAGHEHMTAMALYIAAAEVSVLMSWVAFKGWEGTQLLLGFSLGLYCFDLFYHYAVTTPVLSSFTKQVPIMVGVYTLFTIAGVWAIHERHGGQKVLGLFAPLLGSSFVVSAVGWFAIASCSLPNPPPIGVAVSPADVPFVIQFWNMIVFPMNTEAVGVFGAAGKFLLIGANKYSLDRVLGIFFWVILLLLGLRYQLRTDASREINRTINELSDAQANLQGLSSQLKGLNTNIKGVDKRHLLDSHVV